MVTTFLGRVGDHNDAAMRGSRIVGDALARHLGTTSNEVGTPQPALDAGWRDELAAASGPLTAITAAIEHVMTRRAIPVTALTRCAVALATLPVVARHRPDACVVWFDAHADLHLPNTTSSGYLGGMALSGPLGWWNTGHGGGLAVADVVLGGTRDIDPPEHDLIARHGVVTVEGGPGFSRRLRAAIDARPVYWHLDCDVLEPGIVPTDYHVPGGLTLDDLHAAATVIAEHELVGLEIAEFQDTELDELSPSPQPLLDALAPAITATNI